MALRRKAEAAHQVGQLGAHPRHLGGRSGQACAGPDSGVNRETGQCAAFKHRHDEQVERGTAMDIAGLVGLDHQQAAMGRALGFEPGKGPVVRDRAKQALGTAAADAQRV